MFVIFILRHVFMLMNDVVCDDLFIGCLLHALVILILFSNLRFKIKK